MTEYELTVLPFAMGTEKEAALKPLEEAAEVYAEWQRYGKVEGLVECEGLNSEDIGEIHALCIAGLADEIADTIQAACNLAARYGIDLADAMGRCEERNRRRGRYD